MPWMREARDDDLEGERRREPVAPPLRARRATIEVADNGVGLPADRDRIVEPYMTTRVRGTGLGLAIVKKIVEEHMGTIAFSDRPGGGTVVTMRFDTRLLPKPDHGDSEGDVAIARMLQTPMPLRNRT